MLPFILQNLLTKTIGMLLGASLAFLIIWGILKLYASYRRVRQHPLEGKPSLPGEGLRFELFATDISIGGATVLLLSGAVLIGQNALTNSLPGWVGELILAVLLVGVGTFLMRSLQRHRHYSQGLDGEIAVALELAKIPDATVLHDLSLPGLKHGNIDHLIICRKGVFVVETKANSKLRNGDETRYKAHFDGHRVVYGKKRYDDKVYSQAHDNADVIERMMASRGITKQPKAIITLPGWWIEGYPQSQEEVWLINYKYIPDFLKTLPDILDDKELSALKDEFTVSSL